MEAATKSDANKKRHPAVNASEFKIRPPLAEQQRAHRERRDVPVQAKVVTDEIRFDRPSWRQRERQRRMMRGPEIELTSDAGDLTNAS
ncbi:hypothetical protein [Methylobacterium sp. BTF04]|uniref:hypothetical protein n=1 Tax=Methylobacterium sp. BTF04 TaxID=2708300 RepID=UPI001FEF64E4|nr:hypothetical protein [Methylobacterium sp. BTF04]